MKNLILFLTVFTFSFLLSAHPGGTDKNKCHVKKSTGVKHCHDGKDKKKLKSSKKKKKSSSSTKKSSTKSKTSKTKKAKSSSKKK